MATQKRFIAKNGLDNNAQTITNVATPVNTTDAVTKAYADLKPDLSSTTPAALGTANVGTGTTAARADHVHQSPTTISGNAGTATSIAGQITNGVLYQSGSGVTISTAASTAAGQVLTTTTLGGAPTWVTPTNGTGTVTGVTGTAPVVSSGGTAPAISMAAATTSVSGYLTATDWTTFNGKYSTGGALGTPSSGTLTNCTFPTLNQNTTGTASNITAYTINQSVGTANSPSFPSITTTSNLSIQIGGSASIGFYQDATNTAIRTTASGSIYMQNASGTTTYGYFNSSGLNGNVQGNVSGSSGSCTGNAATATNASAVNGTSGQMNGDGWWRSTGSAGWYSTTYAVGIYSTAVNSLSTYGTTVSFTASGNITAYSDLRLKENIVTVDNALDKVMQLRGVYYNRVEDKTQKRKVGVIAQEIQKVLPEVVLEDNDTNKTLSVDYGNIVGLLIEAIKEQQLQIDSLLESRQWQ